MKVGDKVIVKSKEEFNLRKPKCSKTYKDLSYFFKETNSLKISAIRNCGHSYDDDCCSGAFLYFETMGSSGYCAARFKLAYNWDLL